MQINDLSFEGIHIEARKRIKPFLIEILREFKDLISSIYVVGTAVSEDYDPKTSDINSFFLLKTIDFRILKSFISVGKKYGREKIAMPLFMDQDYLERSLDVFPLEFLNLKLLHVTVYGEDKLQVLEIKKKELRLQLERELKSKLIWLMRTYIGSKGERKVMTEILVNSLKDYIPILRGMIFLFGKEPPKSQLEVMELFGQVSFFDVSLLKRLYSMKKERPKLSVSQLDSYFEEFYLLTYRLSKIVDEFTF